MQMKDNNTDREDFDIMLERYTRQEAERRVMEELEANYDRLHRRVVALRAAMLVVVLTVVGGATAAALPAPRCDYVGGTGATRPALVIGDINETLATL